jgi:HD superfamily phosphohydrolase
MKTNRTKIINDPVHGFITISSPLIYALLEHPYVQRLRSIKQLGLTYLVYPGACHNRLQHALGAMHLMGKALDTLRGKGHSIGDDEREAALAAILLHDVGHGPFSHTLESSIVDDVSHEDISLIFLRRLNCEFGGALDGAIEIFAKRNRKQYLNELVSGQLDVDRLDYLRRDSFFSGVVEGMVGLDRIINMLDIAGDELAVEAKGIYSIENFLISRRLMYWQVYLHKTVLSAETVLSQILRRAKYLSRNGERLFASPALAFFLNNAVNRATFSDDNDEVVRHFADLCDGDIESAARVWIHHPDTTLATLCRMLLHRLLPRTELSIAPFARRTIDEKVQATCRNFNISAELADYFVVAKTISNTVYSLNNKSIMIKYNDGRIADIFEASGMLNKAHTGEETQKYILTYPKFD